MFFFAESLSGDTQLGTISMGVKPCWGTKTTLKLFKI